MMRDPEFGMVRVRAFGTYAFRAVDPAVLLRELVGTDPEFTTDEVDEFIRQSVVARVVSALATSGVAVLDLAAHQNEIAERLAGILSEDLRHLGLALPRFVIENVSLPAAVEAALDTRTQMGVLGDLDRFTRYQAATAITEAASNSGGSRRRGRGGRRRRRPGRPARAGARSRRRAGGGTVRAAAPARQHPVVPRRGRSAGGPAGPGRGQGAGDGRDGLQRQPRMARRDGRVGAAGRGPGARGVARADAASSAGVSAVTGQHQYACPSCGAALEFAPGTAGLACPYCRTRLGIAAPEVGSRKQDYTSYAASGPPPVAELPAFTAAPARAAAARRS